LDEEEELELDECLVLLEEDDRGLLERDLWRLSFLSFLSFLSSLDSLLSFLSLSFSFSLSFSLSLLSFSFFSYDIVRR
jgi:hypothetical protein